MKFTYLKDAGRFAWDEITNNFATWFLLSLQVLLRLTVILLAMTLLGFVGYMLPIFREIGLYTLPCYFVVSLLQGFSPVKDFSVHQITCFYDMALPYVFKVIPVELLSCPGFESVRIALLVLAGTIVLGGFYWLLYEFISYSFVVSRNALDMINGKSLRLFSQRVTSHNFIFGMLAFFILIFSGIILLIVPGVILAVRLSMFMFVLLDEGGTIREAFTKSWNITKGHFFMLLLVTMLYSILNVVPGIGLFMMLVPFVQLFYVGLYARLKHRSPEITVEEFGD